MASPELPSSESPLNPEAGREGRIPGGVQEQTLEEHGQPSGPPYVRLPSETAGGLTGLAGVENPHSGLFPEVPLTKPATHLRDVLPSPAGESKAARRAVWEATGSVPPMAGGAPDKPTERPKQESDDDDLDGESHTDWPPRPGDSVYGDLGLQRDRDLSPGANWLMERLLSGAVDYGEELDYLQWRADKDGIDLKAAIDELDSHGLIVSRKPGWVDLPKKVLPRKDGSTE